LLENIQIYKKPIFKLDFKDIVIENKYTGKCDSCEALLYQDIYAVFANKNTNVCKAYCHICIHAGPGTIILNDSNVLGRTVYPRTLKQVLALTDMHDAVKRFCLVDKKTIEYDNEAIFITLDKNYLLWSDDIQTLYKYLESENYITRKFKTAKKINQYLETLEIVKIQSYKPAITFF
jgi:hypothetical protein